MTRNFAVWSVGSEAVEAQWTIATCSQRKKRTKMELNLATWLAARAQRCCYTFNGRRQCSSLARTTTKLDGVALNGEPSGGTSAKTEWRARLRASLRGENGAEFPLLGQARTVRTLPRRAVATSGVRSSSRHRLLCHTHAHWRPMRTVKRFLWLTSGPRLHFKFPRFSIFQTLKSKTVTFPLSKIHQILHSDRWKHKEQLSFLAQDFKLQILEQIQS
jgi:hypothetical protein